VVPYVGVFHKGQVRQVIMRTNRKDRRPKVPSSPMTSKVNQNIDAIGAMVEREELAINRYQRSIERLVGLISSPLFLAMAITSIALWICANVILKQAGLSPWDPYPFPFLQTIVEISAFLVTSIVLITQNRQAHIAERRSHLDLQVNLLVEQKVAKVIQLLEEMRKDSPQLKDRVDIEAEEMQGATDPALVAAIIEKRFTSTDETSGEA